MTGLPKYKVNMSMILRKAGGLPKHKGQHLDETEEGRVAGQYKR